MLSVQPIVKYIAENMDEYHNTLAENMDEYHSALAENMDECFFKKVIPL